MERGPAQHRRRSIRLRGYDYAQPGAYFVTIVAHGRECLFADIVDGQTRLTEAGRIVDAAWRDLPNHYPGLALDAFVIMPNHVHAIIQLQAVGAGFKPAPTPAERPRPLSEIVRAFKSFSSRRINENRGTSGLPVWQRNYYEHVVRDDESLDRIRCYIVHNPARWAVDRDNPLAAAPEPEAAWRA